MLIVLCGPAACPMLEVQRYVLRDAPFEGN
jgi:hypothetical protein